MRKDLKNSLNEKMQVNLPENLSKDNILDKLENNSENCNEPKKAKVIGFDFKKLIPIAASLVVVAGLLGTYFAAPFDKPVPVKKPAETQQNAEVGTYATYDGVYDKLKEIKRDYQKDRIFNVGGIFHDMYDKAAGNVNFGAIEESADGSADNMAAPESSGEQRKDFGSTNVQEKGVDEGDIIKTDGKYIYILDRINNSFAVVEPIGKEMKIVSKIGIGKGFHPVEMYVQGDRAVFTGSKIKELKDEKTVADGTYNGDADCIGNYGDTAAVVYDISDRTAPQKMTDYVQDGTFDFSRMIDSKLYCVSNTFVDIYDGKIDDGCIPEMKINDVNRKVPADCISVIKDTKIPSYIIITTFDLKKGGEPSVKAVLGNSQELYATTESLYVSEVTYTDGEFTKIHKFDYTDNGVEYKATGRVEGYINNQFSMSSQGKFLRVATTSTITETKASENGEDMAMVVGSNTVNNLYILDENMALAGKVENLAEGERIQSARFVGNMAYIVTFRQTDPLFVIDTTDPKNPKVQGELKIPGFSEYLHPIADGYLLGVGRDGEDNGLNGDCKTALFNVKDPYNPKEVSKISVSDGKYYIYTQVGYNHKLFINLPNGEFAVPFIYDFADYRVEYIRYRVDGDKLEEIARYRPDGIEAVGATYIDNVFYTVTDAFDRYKRDFEDYNGECIVTAFDLNTNEKIGEVKI